MLEITLENGKDFYAHLEEETHTWMDAALKLQGEATQCLIWLSAYGLEDDSSSTFKEFLRVNITEIRNHHQKIFDGFPVIIRNKIVNHFDLNAYIKSSIHPNYTLKKPALPEEITYLASLSTLLKDDSILLSPEQIQFIKNKLMDCNSVAELSQPHLKNWYRFAELKINILKFTVLQIWKFYKNFPFAVKINKALDLIDAYLISDNDDNELHELLQEFDVESFIKEKLSAQSLYENYFNDLLVILKNEAEALWHEKAEPKKLSVLTDEEIILLNDKIETTGIDNELISLYHQALVQATLISPLRWSPAFFDLFNKLISLTTIPPEFHSAFKILLAAAENRQLSYPFLYQLLNLNPETAFIPVTLHLNLGGIQLVQMEKYSALLQARSFSTLTYTNEIKNTSDLTLEKLANINNTEFLHFLFEYDKKEILSELMNEINQKKLYKESANFIARMVSAIDFNALDTTDNYRLFFKCSEFITFLPEYLSVLFNSTINKTQFFQHLHQQYEKKSSDILKSMLGSMDPKDFIRQCLMLTDKRYANILLNQPNMINLLFDATSDDPALRYELAHFGDNRGFWSNAYLTKYFIIIIGLHTQSDPSFTLLTAMIYADKKEKEIIQEAIIGFGLEHFIEHGESIADSSKKYYYYQSFFSILFHTAENHIIENNLQNFQIISTLTKSKINFKDLYNQVVRLCHSQFLEYATRTLQAYLRIFLEIDDLSYFKLLPASQDKFNFLLTLPYSSISKYFPIICSTILESGSKINSNMKEILNINKLTVLNHISDKSLQINSKEDIYFYFSFFSKNIEAAAKKLSSIKRILIKLFHAQTKNTITNELIPFISGKQLFDIINNYLNYSKFNYELFLPFFPKLCESLHLNLENHQKIFKLYPAEIWLKSVFPNPYYYQLTDTQSLVVEKFLHFTYTRQLDFDFMDPSYLLISKISAPLLLHALLNIGLEKPLQYYDRKTPEIRKQFYHLLRASVVNLNSENQHLFFNALLRHIDATNKTPEFCRFIASFSHDKILSHLHPALQEIILSNLAQEPYPTVYDLTLTETHAPGTLKIWFDTNSHRLHETGNLDLVYLFMKSTNNLNLISSIKLKGLNTLFGNLPINTLNNFIERHDDLDADSKALLSIYRDNFDSCNNFIRILNSKKPLREKLTLILTDFLNTKMPDADSLLKLIFQLINEWQLTDTENQFDPTSGNKTFLFFNLILNEAHNPGSLRNWFYHSAHQFNKMADRNLLHLIVVALPSIKPILSIGLKGLYATFGNKPISVLNHFIKSHADLDDDSKMLILMYQKRFKTCNQYIQILQSEKSNYEKLTLILNDYLNTETLNSFFINNKIKKSLSSLDKIQTCCETLKLPESNKQLILIFQLINEWHLFHNPAEDLSNHQVNMPSAS